MAVENAEPRSRWRRALRGLLLVSVAFAVLLGSTLLAVRAGLFREAIRARVEALLSSSLDQPVRVGELAGPLWPRFELRDVRVGATDPPQAELPSVAVAVGSPTFTPRFGWDIESVRLTAPVLRSSRTDAVASSGEAEPPATAGSGDDPPLRILELWIDGARVDAQVAGAGSIALVGDLQLRNVSLADGLPGLAASRGQLHVEVSEGEAGAALFDRGILDAQLEGGRLTLDRADASGAAGSLSLRGVLDVRAWLTGDPEAELRLAVSHQALDLGLLTGRSELASALAGAGDLWLRGPGANGMPTAGQLALALEPSLSPLGPLETGRVDLGWKPAGLHLETLELRGSDFELRGSGRYAERRVDALTLRGRFESLARLAALVAPGEPVTGSVEASAELAGPVDRLTGSVAFEARDLALRGGTWRRVVGRLGAEAEAGIRVEQLLFEGTPRIEAKPGGRVRLADGRVVLEGLELTAEGARVALHGEASREGLHDLQLQVADLDLGVLRDAGFGRDGVEGIIGAELVLDGSYADPVARGDLRWRGAVRDLLPEVDVELAVAPDGSDHRVDVQARSEGRSWLRGRGRLPRRIPKAGMAAWLAQLRFEAELDRLALAPAASLAPAWIAELGGIATGQLEGSFANDDLVPLLTGRLELMDAALRLADSDTRFEAPRVQLALRGQSLVLEETLIAWTGGAAGPAAQIRVAGGLGRRGFTEPFRLQTQGLDAARLGSLVELGAPIAGPVDADLRLAGAYRGPTFEGHVEWRDPVLGEVRGDLLRLDARSEGGPIEVTGELRVGGQPVLSLRGRLPRADEIAAGEWPRLLRRQGVALTIRAQDVALGVLSPFVRGAVREPAGRATGFVEIAGASGGPELSGELDLVDGSLRVPALATTFAPISGRLRLETTRVHLERLRIGAKEGEALLSGQIEHKALRPTAASLALVADRFRLARQGLFQTSVTARATLEGPWTALALEGEATLDDLEVLIPRLPDPTMSEIRVVSDGEAGDGVPADEPEAALPDIAIQLAVGVPEGASIRGLGADLSVEGDITVAKELGGAASYGGELHVVRGTYLFQARRFEVTRGSARLDGSAEPDPLLDVEASHPIRDVTIIARLTGRLSDPIVKLSSEPPLSEDEVLSYVLFGRPASQLTASGQAFVSGAAGQLASGLATSRLGELTQRFLRVDTIDVETNGGTPMLGIGKTLNERTFVRVGKSLEIPAEDEIQVEVKITPQISVQSEITTEGNAGADVLWKLDY